MMSEVGGAAMPTETSGHVDPWLSFSRARDSLKDVPEVGIENNLLSLIVAYNNGEVAVPESLGPDQIEDWLLAQAVEMTLDWNAARATVESNPTADVPARGGQNG